MKEWRVLPIMPVPSPESRRFFGYPVLMWKRRLLKRFLRGLPETPELQLQRLRAHLAQLQGGAFAKDFGLAKVRTPDDLRRALPIASFERVAPYVERAMDGDTTALFGKGIAVVMFAQTSGTTAAAKHIPVTRASVAEYRASWTVWGCGVATQHPWIPFHGVFNIVSSYRSTLTRSGVPTGSITGLLYLAMQHILGVTNVVPLDVALIGDAEARYYMGLRIALARDDLMMVTTANPSTLVTYARKLDLWKEGLIRDVRDGTVRLPERYDARLVKLYTTYKSPERAKMLEKAIVTGGGSLLPKYAWPKLALLGVWTGGTLTPYLESLPQYYGGIPLRDHGLSASEGRMTLPLEDDSPYGVLNVAGAFYEFVAERDYGRDDAPTHLAHELEPGGRYYIVVTTSGGLVRYDLADLVECGGFHGKAPLLRFLNKSSQFSNITGEKLSAFQVGAALRSVQARLALDLGECSLGPCGGDPAGYGLLVEAARMPRDPVAVAKAVDQALAEHNVEYAEKRRSGRLSPVILLPCADGTFERLRERRLALAGGAIEQYKHPLLIRDPSLFTAFVEGRAS